MFSRKASSTFNQVDVLAFRQVLIFSQLTIILDVIAELLEARGWSYVRLDGSTKYEDRQTRIRRFNHEPVECLPVFLVSSRAGGCGLNLQAAADTVIIYDSDWNPQTDLQAQDRCHRIGQTHPVLVIRLVTANSIDETILHRAQTKRGLERLVMAHQHGDSHTRVLKSSPSRKRGKHGFLTDRIHQHLTGSSASSTLPRTEILRLLAQTDYDREVSDVDQLSDDTICQLLDRSDLLRAWREQQQASTTSSGDSQVELTDTSSFVSPVQSNYVDTLQLDSHVSTNEKPIEMLYFNELVSRCLSPEP